MNAIDAPERIWAGEDAIFTRRWREDDQNGGTEYIRADLATPQPANPAQVTDAQIEHMVQQFLRWKLPEDFAPDGGVQFVKRTDYGHTFEPVGTNLFDYQQATEMVRHMLEGLPASPQPVNPAQVADAIERVARMSFGYELMFEALCHIAGTSGGSTSWYTHKAQEITARVSPLHSLTADSNPEKPGDCKSQHLDFMRDFRSAIGAGGQAVAADLETLKARAASVLCEAGALCGWPAPNCNAREGAEALFKAGLLSQPHPADERVVPVPVEFLQEIRGWLPADGMNNISNGFIARIDNFIALAAKEAR